MSETKLINTCTAEWSHIITKSYQCSVILERTSCASGISAPFFREGYKVPTKAKHKTVANNKS